MKWIYRLSSVVILCAALSLPFYADYRSGGTFLELDQLPEKIISAIKPSSAELQGAPISVQTEPASLEAGADSPAQTAVNSSGAITYYRWQDEQGQWHFSDQAPDVASEKAVVDPNALSTISGMDKELIERTNSQGKNTAPEQNSPPAFTATEPSLENLTNVMENAQQAAQMMQERNEALSQIVGE